MKLETIYEYTIILISFHFFGLHWSLNVYYVYFNFMSLFRCLFSQVNYIIINLFCFQFIRRSFNRKLIELNYGKLKIDAIFLHHTLRT